MIVRVKNVHLAGHSNRYFLNDPVPVLDSRIACKDGMICAVDDDGCISLYDPIGLLT